MNNKKVIRSLLSIFMLPVLMLFITLYLQMHKEITHYHYTEKIDTLLSFVLTSSNLIHSLQEERGASHGYLSNKNEHFLLLLADIRKRTDLQISTLHSHLYSIEALPEFAQGTKSLEALKGSIDALNKERRRIDTTPIFPTDTLEYYNRFIADLLTINQEISRFAPQNELFMQANAYINLSYAKEYLGRIRAIGTTMLEQRYADIDLKIALIRAATTHHIYLENFLSTANEATKRHFKEKVDDQTCTQIDEIISMLTHTKQNQTFTIDSVAWFELLTTQIDAFHRFEGYQLERLKQEVKAYRAALINGLLWVLFLNLLMVVITAVLIFFLLRKLKLIEEHLRQKLYLQQNIYEKLFNESGDGVMIVSDKNRIINCNDAVVQLLGYDDKNELLGQTPDLFSPERQPDGQTSRSKMLALRSLSEKNAVTQFEWEHRTKEGSPLHVEVTLTRMQINGENLLHSVVRDITQRKALEKENREQSRQLVIQNRFAQMGEMLAMIAHQWRQPLAAIAATSSLLQTKIALKRYEENAFSTELKNISDFTMHLSDTINDFRDFFKEHREQSAVLLAELIGDTLKIIQPSLNSHNIALVTECLCDEVELSNAHELKQVILNLLVNAQEALLENRADNPHIALKIHCDQHKAYIELADNGGGIQDELLEKIFDPYFTTKGQLNGSGLGLYMSKKIVEEHCGGTLSVKNEDGGAHFIIVLPYTGKQKPDYPATGA